MLRGAEKRMIVVRTRNSPLFEEAYFVVRPDADRPGYEGSDMLLEANRILESSAVGSRAHRSFSEDGILPRRGFLQGVVGFLLGLLTGGGAAGLLWVLLG